MAHAPLSPVQPQLGHDPFQPQGPQGWPDQPPGPQQPYAPGPQPPQGPPPRNAKNGTSHWIRGILAAIGAIAVVSFVLSHISSGGASSSNTAAAAGSAPSQAAAAPPSCADQFTSWRDNGGLSQFQAFSGDLSALQKADYAFAAAIQSGTDLSAAESDEQSAAASLQSDAQAVEANPAPACISGLRTDEGAAMADYSKVAADSQNAMSEVGSGSYDVAGADLRAATKAEDQGNTKLAAALADLKAFQNG